MSTTVPLTTVYASTRNGTATYVQSDGTVATQSALLTRTDHWISGQRGRLFEPPRTNSIRNSTMVGAVAGTLDTTGVLPTNWSKDADIADSSTEIVGTGTEYGMSYVDIRFNGTPSGNISMYLEGSSAIAATSGQAWTLSVYLRLVGGSLTNINQIRLGRDEFASGPSYLSSDFGSAITVDSTLQRYTYTKEMDEATAAYYRPQIIFDWSSGAVDATFRIYGVQAEQGAFATTFIPTSTVAVPRLADRASVALSDIGFRQGEGAITVEGRAYYNASGSGFNRIFQIGHSTNAIQVDIDEASGNVRLVVVAGGATQLVESLSYTSGSYFKIAIRYKLNDSVLSLGGSDSGADTSCTIPVSLATIYWATNESGAGNSNVVFITKFETFAKAFADATLNAETA